MQIQVFSQYIQISILQNHSFLPTLNSEIERFFGGIQNASLADCESKERFFRRILCLQDCQICFQDLQNALHLPIILKVCKPKQRLQTLQVFFGLDTSKDFVLYFSQEEAKEALCKLFETLILYVEKNSFVLNHTKKNFWKEFFSILECKRVENFLLEWKFEKNIVKNLHLASYYAILDSQFGDSYAKVRGNYLRLVRQYHPDNVFSNQELAQSYHQRFLMIQEAFEAIKYHLK